MTGLTHGKALKASASQHHIIIKITTKPTLSKVNFVETDVSVFVSLSKNKTKNVSSAL